MTARMIHNQQRAFLAAALDDTRRLAASLMSLSPAERAAIIATLTAQTKAPVDMVMLYDDPQDARDVEAILDGVLSRCTSVPHAWRLSGDAHFSLVSLRKDGTHA